MPSGVITCNYNPLTYAFRYDIINIRGKKMDKRNKQLKKAVSLRYGAVYAKWMDVLIYLFLFVFAFCLVGSTGNLIYIGKFDYYVFEVVIFSVLVLGLLIFLLS